ncbi:hypothetical protein HJG60_009374 [Phyllostomus discolor]|uniref:Glyceraldehyde-3-phosphate dehydrogenase n=1 Tax=Phyllostomus discolor TaxID=89673 RepID=A0A833YGB6_9CHIR|nr:hypothetical protein HJG60_009374 [Phyllostomus discolor]
MMGRVGVNGFGCVECLVTRSAFYSGKVDVVIINDPFIDLNYIVYMFQYDSTHDKLKGIVKAENGKLIIMESPSPSSRSTILTTSNAVMLVLNMLWSPLVSSLPWRRLGSLEGGSQEGHHLCPFRGCPHVCDGCEP